MDRHDRFPITASREPNPLRPYYIPPSIGPAPGTAPNASAPASQTASIARPPRASSSLHTSASELLPDLDLDFGNSASEAWTNTRTLLDSLAWRYASCLMAQPFDVAKTILQVSLPPSGAAASVTPRKRRTSPRDSNRYSSGSRRRRERSYESYSETDEAEEDLSEDDDVPDYFTSSVPRSRSPRKRRRTPPSISPSPDPTPTQSRNAQGRRSDDPESEYKLSLKRPDSVSHAISTLYNTSGAVGLWRATNCTFLYSILIRTTDSFVRSLLLALFGLPDIGGPDQGILVPGLMGTPGTGTAGLDLTDMPSPLLSLAVIGLSSCLSGLLLLPLDIVRTRLIVTPTSHSPRGVLSNLKRLPSLLADSSLWLPTALYHTVPQLITTSFPQLMRRKLHITPEASPNLWSLAAFGTSLTELFVRLPLETIARRAQVQYLRQTSHDIPLIVEPAPYLGVSGTVYSILYSEGETKTKDAKGMIKIRKGQGTSGLVRGWRIGFWGLVGVWGAGAIGSGSEKGRGEF